MTSIRTFQSEIEEIRTRELAKQRAQLAGDHREKDSKNPLPKGRSKGDGDGMGKLEQAAMPEVEEEIQVSVTWRAPGIALTYVFS